MSKWIVSKSLIGDHVLANLWSCVLQPFLIQIAKRFFSFCFVVFVPIFIILLRREIDPIGNVSNQPIDGFGQSLSGHGRRRSNRPMPRRVARLESFSVPHQCFTTTHGFFAQLQCPGDCFWPQGSLQIRLVGQD